MNSNAHLIHQFESFIKENYSLPESDQKKDLCFHLAQNIIHKMNEDNTFVPRFNFKELAAFKGIEVNKPMKYEQSVMIKAIEYGLIFQIDYKGEKDDKYSGHTRVIYPMVLGLSARGKELLRGYHLNGWSVSHEGKVEKIWRMFRTDRILNVTFLGSFYRLAPEGYNEMDKGMRGGIIAAANFDKIRKKQDELLKQSLIQNKSAVTLNSQKTPDKVEVKVEDTETTLDLTKAMDNPYVSNVADIDGMRINFLKTTVGNKYIALIGGLGETGNKIILFNTKGKLLGAFKVLDSIEISKLKNIKRVKGNVNYDVYLFKNKIGEDISVDSDSEENTQNNDNDVTKMIDKIEKTPNEPVKSPDAPEAQVRPENEVNPHKATNARIRPQSQANTETNNEE